MRCKLIMALVLMLPINFAHGLEVLVERGAYEAYLKFIGERDPLTITEYSGPHARRTTVELVLVQQALVLGGLNDPVEFVFAPNAGRLYQNLQNGTQVMLGNSVWKASMASAVDKVMLSPAIISDGEYEVGMYTIESNGKALAANSLSDVQQLRAVSSRAWHSDWATLSAMQLNLLHSTVKWSSMKKMVATGRIDFLLAPFQSSGDLSFVAQDIRYVPIPGLKLGLRGSRHFVVSQQHPDYEKVSMALQKGVSLLKQEGRFRKAFEQSGFFNDAVRDWVLIKP
ncbi:hypothetical protein [Vibrio sp. SCSIO 43136]|uniref:hypothetical protein n=1 Tax=Vibrio sp. SCSIO 43136 TaxID=2819101 RepID=UPI0020757F1A|nr:hypothetical protein [Vibrio sp. SCSIO 43136]USD68052.1 hypothetical protein J4N39_17920 [Vibrio sp. SCSIO 43136]